MMARSSCRSQCKRRVLESPRRRGSNACLPFLLGSALHPRCWVPLFLDVSWPGQGRRKKAVVYCEVVAVSRFFSIFIF
jgi:hypothetical protein